MSSIYTSTSNKLVKVLCVTLLLEILNLPASILGFFQCCLVISLGDKGILMLPDSLYIFEKCNQFGGGWNKLLFSVL